MLKTLHIAIALILSAVTAASGAATGTMSVMGGFVAGTGTINGVVEVRANGSLYPGVTTVGTLPIDGDLDVSVMADTGGTGVLGFSLNAPAATSDRITATGTLTIGVGKLGFSDFAFTDFGGVNIGTYTLITSAGITSGNTLDSANLSGPVGGSYTGTLRISGNNIILVVNSEAFINWADSYYASADVSSTVGNNDADGLNNLQEFAFGTNPTVSDSVAMAYDSGGAVTTPGNPVPLNLAVLGTGVDFRAIFCRRKDYVAAKLTYTVQFSVDNFAVWENSLETPTVLTGAGVLNPSAVEAVSVPYPFFIAYTRDGIDGFEVPRFFRVGVSQP